MKTSDTRERYPKFYLVKMKENDLKKLGINEKIQETVPEFIKGGLSLARVIEVNKNSYIVSTGIHEMFAELAGKFLLNVQSSTSLPTVGDWVAIKILNNFTFAIIHSILPRNTLLKRKESGRRIDYQMIAANIDFGLVMQPADQVNLKLLERYFVMLNECGIEPIVVISKIDLLSSQQTELLKCDLLKLRHQFILISSTSENGTTELSKNIIPYKTYCLLGKSGVGKTTLLNALLKSSTFKVNKVREKDGRGRHTTVKRQLICLNSGSIIIDTPGIRELGNFEIDAGLEMTFDNVLSYSQNCRFKDCTHIHETGCAILQAVKDGEIDTERFENFKKIKKEADFNKMSILERSRKDKSFGKMIKNYKKSIRA